MAVLNRPTASRALLGITTLRPGSEAKRFVWLWLWYIAPPWRYPPEATRTTTGDFQWLYERQRMLASSFLICM